MRPERIIVRPDWPRLMSEADAAAYLSIGATTLRDRGPEPKRLGSRVLWDRRDLDRWADALAGQPLDGRDADDEARETERRFLERRKAGTQHA
jgi:hypothetical protein